MKDIIFIHINKCGGTSMTKSLSGFKHVYIPSNDSIKNLVHKNIWINSYKFTIVRNPYHRFLSLYEMFKRNKNQKSFNKMLEVISDDNIRYDVNSGGKTHHRKEHIKRHGLPMTHKHYGVFDNEKNILRINKVFKLEELEKAWPKIEEIIGKKLTKYKLNASNTKKEISKFTKKQLETINKIYAKDFEVFNYEKINPEDLYGA